MKRDQAILANTKAIRENTEWLKRLHAESRAKRDLERRRKVIREGAPYSHKELMDMKWQDLVMLARQLGIKDTSIGQGALVGEVERVQDGK